MVRLANGEVVPADDWCYGEKSLARAWGCSVGRARQYLAALRHLGVALGFGHPLLPYPAQNKHRQFRNQWWYLMAIYKDRILELKADYEPFPPHSDKQKPGTPNIAKRKQFVDLRDEQLWQEHVREDEEARRDFDRYEETNGVKHI